MSDEAEEKAAAEQAEAKPTHYRQGVRLLSNAQLAEELLLLFTGQQVIRDSYYRNGYLRIACEEAARRLREHDERTASASA